MRREWPPWRSGRDFAEPQAAHRVVAGSSVACGRVLWHRSMVWAQRPAKAQPRGMSTSSGTLPRMVGSRPARCAPMAGRAANRPRV
jgi:hypothetical protein